MSWPVVILSFAVLYLLALRWHDVRVPPYALRHLIEQARADFQAAVDGTMPDYEPQWRAYLLESLHAIKDKDLRRATWSIIEVFNPDRTVHGYPAMTHWSKKNVDWQGLVKRCDFIIGRIDQLALRRWRIPFRV